MTPGQPCRFSTPAKINLFLRIQRKRADGYHDLLLDYIPVSLFDQIELQPCNSNSLELTGNLAGLSVDDNLIIKAIRLLEWEIGQPISLRIHLQKNIPTGAGLGGGSGNAAGTLVVLNRLLHLSLSDHRLKQMAIQLGADVPFFISPQPSLACGIGEQLTPLPDFDPLPLLLVYPGFPISTAEAYRICLISGENAPLHQYTMDEICRLKPEMNDFWGPLTIHYPALEKCRMTLMENKASASGLSGSGSTIFGVFETREIRDRAAASLKNHSSWQIFPCETLASYRYPLDKQSA
ncbi:4-(cytidine 5'-diphospho)-2-C-methyl-D-erythritol kinase [bacterium]|nr:4-(cytidine 5'-diphospho)-2-C-methyl-D-erythritol kinase [bacterium]